MDNFDNNQVLFFGDTHGHFDHVNDYVRTYKPESIVFLGDLQPKQHLHDMFKDIDRTSQVWFIHGNHDADTEHQEKLMFKSPWACRNINGKVITLPSGLRLCGLGGVFRGEIWMPPMEEKFNSWTAYVKERKHKSNFALKQRRHRTTIFPNVFKKMNHLKTDVFVTHQAPSKHEMGFECLDKLAEALDTKFWCHGHHHEYLTYEYPNMTVCGAPYRGVVNLKGELLP